MPAYDFRTLSSSDFEELTRDLLQEEWKITLESFKSGKDQGIDLRHISAGGIKTIIQCKHYVGSGFKALLSKLEKEELPKIHKLEPDRYILVTSVPLSPANKSSIRKACAPFISTDNDVLGQGDLNNLLGKFENIEKKNFKLWLTSQSVLDRILNNASVVQSEFEVREIAKKIPLYVQNDSFSGAMKILEDQRFVIISGEPGIGKTTLAEMLVYTYLEQNYTPVIVDSRNPEDAFQRYTPNTSMIFYFDDFLGETFAGDSGNNIHDKTLIRLIDLVRNSSNAMLIMTTREYVLQTVLKTHEKLDHSKLLNNKYILELAKYTKVIRGRILYNHLYFSDLDSACLDAVVQSRVYLKIIDHKNYSPRIIEWVTKLNSLTDVSAVDYPDFILSRLNNPERLWEHAYTRQISFAAQTMLLALLSLNGSSNQSELEMAFDALYEFASNKSNQPMKLTDFKDALKELEGSFIAIHKNRIEFQNPSIKDFLQYWVHQNPSLSMDIFCSAVRFAQVSSIWNVLNTKRSQGISDFIFKHSERMFTTIERLVEAPHYNKTQQDVSYCSRISILVEMAEACNSDVFYNPISGILENVESQGFHLHDSLGEWADTLELLDLATFLSDEIKENTITDIKEMIINHISEVCLLDEFEKILNIGTYRFLDADDMDHIGGAFNNYDAYEEFSALDTSTELKDYLSRFKETSITLESGFSETPDGFDEVYSKICQEEEDYGSDDKNLWRKYELGREQEDHSIDEMFMSLTDK